MDSRRYSWMLTTMDGWIWLSPMILCRIFFIATSMTVRLKIKVIFPDLLWMEKDARTPVWELRQATTIATGKWTFMFPRFRMITKCYTATMATWDLRMRRQKPDWCG